MRIACLQFAPKVGDISNNLNRADVILNRSNMKDIDLIVLPELAFSGYNFTSLQQISPYLEPTTAGITSLWARTMALKYNCFVHAGYPEKVDVRHKWPADPEYYNSAITINKAGETIGNYRKHFLYYTDETWALEGPAGFFAGKIDGLGNVAMGICMDLNPYRFEAPWDAWEFANHVLHRESNLVILSMAWLTREEARSYSRAPREPDLETLSYWISRLEPVIRAEGEEEIIVVFANRCGSEGDAVYAGTSAVLGIQNGEVRVYGILGRGERELLVVDTSKRPAAHLISDTSGKDDARPVQEDISEDLSDAGDSLSSAVTAESFGSIRSRESELSISTAPTSANLDSMASLPIEGCSLTPASPDGRFPQSYFGSLTSPTTPKVMRPSNYQQAFTPSSRSQIENYPGLPKARNASPGQQSFASSPGTNTRDISETPSPRSSNASLSQQAEVEELLFGSDFEPVTETTRSARAAFRAERARRESQNTEIEFRPTPEDNIGEFESRWEESQSKTSPRTIENDINRTAFAASVVPARQEYSFLRSDFGPRDQHISPRPISTIW